MGAQDPRKSYRGRGHTFTSGRLPGAKATILHTQEKLPHRKVSSSFSFLQIIPEFFFRTSGLDYLFLDIRKAEADASSWKENLPK